MICTSYVYHINSNVIIISLLLFVLLMQLLNIASGISSTQSWSGSLWKAETRDEKLEKLGQVIPRLEKQVELLQDRVGCANENLRSDIQRWNAEKQADLKSMLITMADHEIQHYQQCMNAWEKVLVTLKLNGIFLIPLQEYLLKYLYKYMINHILSFQVLKNVYKY